MQSAQLAETKQSCSRLLGLVYLSTGIHSWVLCARGCCMFWRVFCRHCTQSLLGCSIMTTLVSSCSLSCSNGICMACLHFGGFLYNPCC